MGEPNLRQWLVWVLGGGVLAGCLSVALAVTALQFAPLGGPLPMGYTVLACANVSARPAFQLSLSWMLPQLLSSIIPNPPWSRGCAYLIWAPFLPPSGFWHFPP